MHLVVSTTIYLMNTVYLKVCFYVILPIAKTSRNYTDNGLRSLEGFRVWLYNAKMKD
jgi:hypothetical protein